MKHLPVVGAFAATSKTFDYESKTQAFSTRGGKILQHAGALREMQEDRHLRPITVQLAPTEICSSHCPFCSVSNRPVNQKIPWNNIIRDLTEFRELGAKAVEFTGGGDPLLYRDGAHDINDLAALALDLGLEVGIITDSNNLGMHLDASVAHRLAWVRVSMIKLDEGRLPEDYDFSIVPEGRVGLSYIIYDGTSRASIEKIACVVELNPAIKFVRIASDCLENNFLTIKTDWDDIIRALDRYDKFFIKEINEDYWPFPGGCWVGALRPYETSAGVFICTSHVLIHRTYHPTWKLCDSGEIKATWAKMNERFKQGLPPYEIDIAGECKKCFYAPTNRILSYVVNALPDKNFT